MLDEPTKRRIAKVLDEATELTRTGADEYDAAREALTAQVSNVYRELAVAAVVDSVRRRIRAETLEADRAGPQDRGPRDLTAPPCPSGVRAVPLRWVPATHVA
jgi:hypothetical protein